ncbi:MAG TPA: histidine kinase, partial [Casimicrobiaceae bacterium]|nr:histidine kinase [Casimicrobiaceae bacterium]
MYAALLSRIGALQGRWHQWCGHNRWFPSSKRDGLRRPLFEHFTWRSAVGNTVIFGLMTLLIVFNTHGSTPRDIARALPVFPLVAWLVSLWTFALVGETSSDKASQRHFRFAAIVGPVLSLLVQLVMRQLFQAAGVDPPASGFAYLVVWSILPLAFMSWLHYDHLRGVAARQARERLEAERQARALSEARMHVLQAQIEPHFLFNALSHLETLIG